MTICIYGSTFCYCSMIYLHSFRLDVLRLLFYPVPIHLVSPHDGNNRSILSQALPVYVPSSPFSPHRATAFVRAKRFSHYT